MLQVVKIHAAAFLFKRVISLVEPVDNFHKLVDLRNRYGNLFTQRLHVQPAAQIGYVAVELVVFFVQRSKIGADCFFYFQLQLGFTLGGSAAQIYYAKLVQIVKRVPVAVQTDGF